MPSRPRETDERPADPSPVASSDDSGYGPNELSALIEFGTARLADTPAVAEGALRRAVRAGAAVLPPDQLARLYSLIVTAICGQPGREADLAAAALVAADRWWSLSANDAAHYTLLAARLYYRCGRHHEAVGLYRRGLSCPDLPYPAPEIAVLHEQYGTCLLAVHRYRSAATVFDIGARLAADDPDCRDLHRDLLASASTARAAARPIAALRRALAASLARVRRPATR
ncbi:hypothetical protein [Nocardia blacklockiae]|uniref:hypothetical protein n=1 Tax=Nocardia blacklockiae TaxID=480036 RepID=UPI001894B292|nr:hypothetical protein [Nocardia blacklockiae]MBF6172229.1 hypothetical protein [Nocardia blacklockiae]